MVAPRDPPTTATRGVTAAMGGAATGGLHDARDPLAIRWRPCRAKDAAVAFISGRVRADHLPRFASPTHRPTGTTMRLRFYALRWAQEGAGQRRGIVRPPAETSLRSTSRRPGWKRAGASKPHENMAGREEVAEPSDQRAKADNRDNKEKTLPGQLHLQTLRNQNVALADQPAPGRPGVTTLHPPRISPSSPPLYAS